MNKKIIIGAAGALAYYAWKAYQDAQDAQDGQDSGGYWFAAGDISGAGSGLLQTAEGVLTDATQTTAQFVDNLTGGMMKVSAMANVPRSVLANANVQAMLKVIRAGEGTLDGGGYSRLFGGQQFSSFADHPRVTVKSGGYTSTAAGAYQALASSWDETKRIMGLPDFSPASQDLFAVGRIAARGALEDVIAGRFDAAIKKISREWASLPGSPYGQPTISLDRARALFSDAGGAQTVYG